VRIAGTYLDHASEWRKYLAPTVHTRARPVEQPPAHHGVAALPARKVRNPEEVALTEKQSAGFGVHIYQTDAEIDDLAIGSTNVEQML
jgi:hypothetical protein